MPTELREQQNNQLGKTFMPYTQSNYRWGVILSVWQIVWCNVLISECTRWAGQTGTRVGSRLWTRSRALSAGTPGTSPTSVPRGIWPSSATTTTRSESRVRDREEGECCEKIHSESYKKVDCYNRITNLCQVTGSFYFIRYRDDHNISFKLKILRMYTYVSIL